MTNMDNWKKLEETQLPSNNSFQSNMNVKGLSDQDYEQTQQVWKRKTHEFENATLGEYHGAYLAIHVLPF